MTKCYIILGKRKATQTHKERDRKQINNEEVFTMNNNVFYFEGFEEFDTDITLDNVNPWLLIATYTNADVA